MSGRLESQVAPGHVVAMAQGWQRLPKLEVVVHIQPDVGRLFKLLDAQAGWQETLA